jgi:hypothetical protein
VRYVLQSRILLLSFRCSCSYIPMHTCRYTLTLTLYGHVFLLHRVWESNLMLRAVKEDLPLLHTKLLAAQILRGGTPENRLCKR